MRNAKLTVLFFVTALLGLCSALGASKWEMPNGAPLSMNGVLVTVSTYDSNSNPAVFVSKTDRSSSIRVWAPYAYLEEGQCVSLEGYKTVFRDTGEPVLVIGETGLTSQEYGFPQLRPLGMSQKALSSTLALNTYGRIWGKVTGYSGQGYYLDDGSSMINTAYVDGSNVLGTEVLGYTERGVGEQAAVNGVASLENHYGTVVPIFYASQTQASPTFGSRNFTVSGMVAADVNAIGKKARIHIDTKSADIVISQTGGSYSLTLPEGEYVLTAEIISYKTVSRNLSLHSDQSGFNFTLSPLSPTKVVDVISPYNIFSPGMTIDIDVRVRDLENRGLSDESVTAVLDNGRIITSLPALTNSDGIVHLRIRASNLHEGARLIVTSGDARNVFNLFYAGADDPICWPIEADLLNGETVSGDVPVVCLCEDMTVYPSIAADTMKQLKKYSFYVDDQLYDEDIPQPESWANGQEDPYQSLSARVTIRTNNLNNGFHTARFRIEDEQGNTFLSPAMSFVSDNFVYSYQAVSSNPSLPNEADLLNGGNITITAALRSPASWIATIYDFDPTNPDYFVNPRVIGQGTGSTVSVVWDGKVYQAKPISDQPCIAYFKLDLAQSGGIKTQNIEPGIPMTRWYGVRVIPDTSIQVLCSVGKPQISRDQKWKDDGALNLWPVKSYTMYRRARDKGWSAKILGPDQNNWPRWSSIVMYAPVRLLYHEGHGKFDNTLGSKGQTVFSMPGGPGNFPTAFVTSRPAPGYTDLEQLGLEYRNKLWFFFLHSCNSGTDQGYLSDTSRAPQVAANKRHDVAQVLGFYYPGNHPKCYLGVYDFSYGGWDWCNFMSSVNSPYGMFQLWGQNTGTTLNYVIGGQGYSGARILTQLNSPNSWVAIKEKLRAFGCDGSTANNDGFRDLMFSVY